MSKQFVPTEATEHSQVTNNFLNTNTAPTVVTPVGNVSANISKFL